MCEICDGRSPREVRRARRRRIERYGWALQYVEATADDRGSDDRGTDEHGIHPAYCYSIGLTATGKPELVITGRVADQSAEALNELVSWAESGLLLTAGDIHTVGGLDVCLVEVRECEHWLLGAVDLYGPKVRALQAVWADCGGLFPWEGALGSVSGWNGAAAVVQPLLGPPPSGWSTGAPC